MKFSLVSEKEIQRKRKNIFTFLQAFELEIILFPNIIIKLYLNGFEVPECKLKERKFKLEIMKKSFTVRVVTYWKKLPTDLVNILSLAVLKARLEGTLSYLVTQDVSLPMAGVVETRC